MITRKTHNGISRAAGCLNVCSNSPMPYKTGKLTALPASLPPNYTDYFIDLDVSAGDVDLTSWSPGVAVGAKIRVRKCDDSTNKITFTDTVTDYSFVDQKGEAISLYSDGSNLCFDC